MSSVPLLMAALLIAAPAAAGPASTSGLRADLERISRERIYFGHQSVGANLLQGMEELAAGAGVSSRRSSPRLRTQRRCAWCGKAWPRRPSPPPIPTTAVI